MAKVKHSSVRYKETSSKKEGGEKDVSASPKVRAFAFGDPEPSLKRSNVIGFLTPSFDDYYDLPLSVQGLAESLVSSVHHASAIKVKRNLIVANFIEHKHLKRGDFSRFVYDYLVFGNSYMEKTRNKLGGILGLKPAPSKFVRKHKNGNFGFIKPDDTMHPFKAGSIFHLLEADVNQEIYGVPDYIASLHSVWLNESATLFRRKYYENGAHAGYIMYLTDNTFSEEDVEALEEQIKQSKGPGNFKSLFMYAPDGKKDGLQIIHLSEATAKDQFSNIKNISRDDVLAAHRVPPQLMGIVPSNTGGFGSIRDAQEIFNRNEIRPIQERMKELNEWVGEEVVRFRPFDFEEKTDGES